jgi:hypothetical protein
MRATCVVGFAALSVSVAVAFAAPVQQTRDNGAPAGAVATAVGTGVLSGTLMTDTSTPQPVRRATVRLSGASGTSNRIVGSDDDGKFTFPELPAGTYTLSATKLGYVTAFYGSKKPGRGPGVSIAVADGQRVSVPLKMLVGAAITGTITDENGTPAVAVPVVAVDTRTEASIAAPVVRALTDDRGVYRLFGLAPGDYVLSAVPKLGDSTVVAPASSAAMTDAQSHWIAAQSTNTGTSTPPPADASTRQLAYAPVYFPGTTDARGAALVTVTAGEERSGVGFPLRATPVATIGGMLLDQDGQPLAQASVQLFAKKTDHQEPSDVLFANGTITLPRNVAAPPRFSIPGVAPGEYTLVARSGSSSRGGGPQPPPLWNMTDIVVNGEDQTNLVLRLQLGTKISGTIVFDSLSSGTVANAGSAAVTLKSMGSYVGTPAAPRATVTPAGAFLFSSVVPGPYTFQASVPGTNWVLKSAIAGGRDLADVPLDVKPDEDLTDVKITFTDHPSQFSGRLIDSKGAPLSKYSIVVLPVDRSLWRADQRRIRATPPATDGSFHFIGLPAGDYAVSAVEDVEPADLADPAFLADLLAKGYKLTLGDGEKKTLDMKTGG